MQKLRDAASPDIVASKAAMRFLGIDCGPVRRPLENMSPQGYDQLCGGLRDIHIFDKQLQKI